MKLFGVAKVGLFCDGVAHSLEKRRGEDVKVLTLTLRVAPFDAKLASAVGDDNTVRQALFNTNNIDPKPFVRRVDFALGCERQNLHVFAAPDTERATLTLDQVRITGTYARAQKDRNGFDFVLKATFGPAGRDELEFVQGWLLTQKFVTFEEAEPGLLLDEEAEDATEADEKARDVVDGRPLDWDDEADAIRPAAPVAEAHDAEPARTLPRRHRDRKTAAKAKQKTGRRK